MPKPVLPHITVCICTFKRPAMLESLLRELGNQNTDGAFTFSAVVADNDAEESARKVVALCAPDTSLSIVYCVERERNIAAVRNLALAHARGEFVAFIDDDELPSRDWLLFLYRTCQRFSVAGVLGPVNPRFTEQTPGWVVKSGIYDRPSHATGYRMPWQECRTGNVLFRREILNGPSAEGNQGVVLSEPPFRPEFGTGGEDQDFFRRMMARGHRFLWCNEAPAWEIVPPSRCNRRFMLSRALLRGRNTFRHGEHRVRNLVKSALAIPAYLLALPLFLLGGQHLFMRYLVKLTDHTGRVLALFGLNPVHERQM